MFKSNALPSLLIHVIATICRYTYMFALIGHGCGALIEHMILNRYRLGIIQGGSHTFVAPIVAMMAVDRWACPDTSGNVIFGLVHACRLQLLSSDQLLILACT